MKKISVRASKAKKSPVAPPAIEAKPARKAPPKAPPSEKTATKIVAKIDVGFGNTLYLRGDGGGLSWNKGIAMECTADDEWSILLSDVAKPVVFKFLLNDLTWSGGNDYLIEPGGSATLTPTF